MGYLVRMPKLGLEMKQGTLLEWHVEPGTSVEEGDVLAEIESEKTTAEVTARDGGVLRKTGLEPGASVEPGAAIAIVADADEDISDLESELEAVAPEEGEPEAEPADATAAEDEAATEAAEPEARKVPAGGASEVKASPRARDRAADLGVELATVEGSGPGGAITEADVEAAASGAQAAEPTTPPSEIKASPRARSRAEELGVDLTRVEGTGPGGAITEADVDDAAEAAPPGAAGPATRTVREEVEFGGMRRTIADRLSQSARNAVHVTEQRTADAEALLEASEAAKGAISEGISMQDILLRTISATLDAHPSFNATYEDEVHTIYNEQNVGLAVDVDAGLIAPVLPDLGEKSLEEIAAARRDLTDRARSGEYTMDDLTGGTFTVTNLGVLGVESFDPIINPPQVAILGINAIAEQPERTEMGIEFRRKLPFSLSFDHRVVDGADAARFLQTLVEHVENPWPLLPAAVSPPGVAEPTAGRVVSTVSEAGGAGRVTVGPYTWDWGEEAPSPVHLFLGSLAGCLGYFVRLEADNREVDVGEITVTAGTEADHGEIEALEVIADIESDLDADTVRDIVEAAEADCVVSYAIRDDVPMPIHLAGEPDADPSALGRAVTATTTDGKAGTMTTDSHTWEYGGDATPVHVFLGSLVACLAYFSRDQAIQRDVDIGRIDIQATTPNESGEVESIDLVLCLETEADTAPIDELVETAKEECVIDTLIDGSIPVEATWERA